jgi:hypothetical protein
MIQKPSSMGISGVEPHQRVRALLVQDLSYRSSQTELEVRRDRESEGVSEREKVRERRTCLAGVVTLHSKTRVSSPLLGSGSKYPFLPSPAGSVPPIHCLLLMAPFWLISFLL